MFPGTPVRPRRGTTTIVAVTTLEELLARTGTGITDTGDRLTVGSLIESTLATDLYLQVLDFQGRSLWLGRSRRLGSLDQYLALLGEEGMSTAPGSSACAARCAMHHIDGWNHGGDTDIDNLTFTDTSTHARVDDTRTNPNRWFTLRPDSAGDQTAPRPAHPRSGAPGDPPTPPEGGTCPYPGHQGASACPRTREEKVTWVPPRTVDPRRRPRVNHHPDMWDHPASRLRRTGSLHRGGTAETPSAPPQRRDAGECDAGQCDAGECDTRELDHRD
ncbi:HNH endonuclease [Corynebacterium bovis]|uniref:HNH endonuclease signature motif containing protein n=1 Tax=Corynebacterium bovis TaxID=36808 RepID=UPI0031396D7E